MDIIKAICLRVDKAIIFFKSYSQIAKILAKIKVELEIHNSNLLLINEILRNPRYTPAVTRVEECTKEETGVGAAIAKGSQALKGIWALFVIITVTNKICIDIELNMMLL